MSECVQGLEDASVAGLMMPDGAGWDEDIIRDLFVDRDSALIRKIPLSKRVVADKLIWTGEQDGRFSVKSCYRIITGEIVPTEWAGWTSMWRFNLPPKIKIFFWQVCSGCLPTTENLKHKGVACVIRCGLCREEGVESLLHLFIHCGVAREAWGNASWTRVDHSALSFMEWLEVIFKVLKKEEIERFIAGCWGLWGERNQRVWHSLQMEGKQVMAKTRAYVDGWAMVQRPVVSFGDKNAGGSSMWQRPVAGRRKINVDASTGGEHCGFGWVIRDCCGSFLAGGSIAGSGQFTPLEAELMSVREALSWIKTQQWDLIDLETDSLLAVHEIQKGSGCSYSSVLAKDIRDMMTSFVSITCSHVRRSANRPAHVLARAASSLSESRVWFSIPPSFIIDVLNNDLINSN